MKATKLVSLVALAALALAGCTSSSADIDRSAYGLDANTPEIPAGVTYNPADNEPVATPAINGVTLEGEQVQTADFLNDKVTIIHFFGSWCTECLEAEEDFNVLREQYGDALDFVYINGDTKFDETGTQVADQEKAEQYIAYSGLKGVVIIDGSLKTWSNYAVFEPPATGIITADGKLTRLWLDGTSLENLQEKLAPLITQP
ncbi:MAG: TlpA family protein disulfide reductase [Propionibacteriaceae bacterium]|jgi:thiol-disulfide isomerase/thioredoxin|nr:TlpA family protein disulfide reductase [Propionibacteriaceae bacterium]